MLYGMSKSFNKGFMLPFYLLICVLKYHKDSDGLAFKSEPYLRMSFQLKDKSIKGLVVFRNPSLTC